MAGEPAFSSRIEGRMGFETGEWDRVLSHLRDEVDETAHLAWLESLRLERIDGDEAVVAAPTRFRRNWVATHYADRLLSLWRAENSGISRLSLVVEQLASGPVRDAEPPVMPSVTAEPMLADGAEDRGLLTWPLDPRFTFDTFVVGKPNELAQAAARRVAEACVSPDQTVPFNPLFQYGGVGLGPNHLMHAIAWHVRLHAPSR